MRFFFQSLRWKVAPDLKTAYMELAFEFWHRGFRLIDTKQTMAAYATQIRKFISQVAKVSEDNVATPGTMQPGCKSCGKTLPAGFISGCLPILSTIALKSLALPLFKGRTHQLRLWEEEFN